MLKPGRMRRRLLHGLLAVPVAALLRHAEAATPPEDARFIARALELARHGNARGDGTPYGALVVKDGVIVAEAWNRAHLHRDATAHAEVEAIREAARILGRRDLAGCTLYTNGGRPCPMCEGAAYFANIERLVYGRDVDTITDAGRPSLGGC
jgi:tRNA(Arg) A34 adenosine deaminase TadA